MNEEHISRKKFIRLGTMLGVGVGSASLLAACGGGGESGEGGGQPTAESEEEKNTTQASGPEVSKGEIIAEASEVPANSAKAFTDTDTGQAAVLVHLQSGDFAAYSAVCTHEGCLVSYQPQSQELVCPCHGSIFDPAQGAAVEKGPAKRPLPQIGVTVENGEIIRA